MTREVPVATAPSARPGVWTPPEPTRNGAAARLQAPTFRDRRSPEERRRGLPAVPEAAGGRGPAPDA